jgi:hypothetical protein
VTDDLLSARSFGFDHFFGVPRGQRRGDTLTFMDGIFGAELIADSMRSMNGNANRAGPELMNLLTSMFRGLKLVAGCRQGAVVIKKLRGKV